MKTDIQWKTVICFLLVNILTLYGFLNTETSALKDSGVAYIFIGDVNPDSDVQQFIQSTAIGKALGVDPDPRSNITPLLKKKIRVLQERGYQVRISKTALRSDLKKALLDESTKAIVWFGHGDKGNPGSFYCEEGSAGADSSSLVIPDHIRDWARIRIARSWGWVPAHSRDEPDFFKITNGLSKKERREKWIVWKQAHFNLEYAYFHTCHVLNTNVLPNLLMKKNENSEFYGYQGVKESWDESGVLQSGYLNGFFSTMHLNVNSGKINRDKTSKSNNGSLGHFWSGVWDVSVYVPDCPGPYEGTWKGKFEVRFVEGKPLFKWLHTEVEVELISISDLRIHIRILDPWGTDAKFTRSGDDRAIYNFIQIKELKNNPGNPCVQGTGHCKRLK